MVPPHTGVRPPKTRVRVRRLSKGRRRRRRSRESPDAHGDEGGCSVFQLRVRNGKKDCDVWTPRARARLRRSFAPSWENEFPLVHLTVRDRSVQIVMMHVEPRHQV